MRKNLRSKILLCILAGGVLAANTAFAAEYNVPFFGSNDDQGIYDDIRTNEDKEYTYDVGENAVLTVSANGTAGDYSKNAYGIIIVSGLNTDWTNAANTDKITILDSLDINVTGNGGNYAAGIAIKNSDVSQKTIDRSKGGKITVMETDAVGSAKAEGVAVEGSNNIVLIGNSNLDVSATGESSNVSGLAVEGNANTIDMGDGYIKAIANTIAGKNTSYADVYSTGIKAWDTSSVITKNVDITATATGNEFVAVTMANGIDAEYGESTVTTGNGDVIAKAINTGSGASSANGIYATDGATVIKGNGKVSAVAQGEGTLAAIGINLRGEGTTTTFGIVDISAQTIGGNSENGNSVKSIGIWTRGESESIVNVAGGSITAEAFNSDGVTENEDADVYAILTENTSTVNVNQGTSNDVVINGDVETRTDAVVYLNLNTATSEFNGTVYDDSSIGTTLNLANGAEWNNTGASNLNTLSMDGGVINQNSNDDITINNYSGTGDINFEAEDTDNNGILDFTNTGNVTINKSKEGSAVNLGVTNNTVNTLDIEKTEENLNAIAEKVSYNGTDGNLTGKVTVKEGLITPEASGDLVFSQNGAGSVANITGGDRVTKTMDAMQHLAETAIVAWRQEDSTLSQRLGELRNSDGGQGVWVRMSRGEFEYDGAYKNQYNFFQMGYDWASGDWHYGAAVSHNDGQTTYAQGDGENRSTSLSLYGTWLGDKGHYADIVLKQGRLSNDFDIYTEAGHTSGDYDAWGTSLSGEYGMKVALNDGWYVTPQAQLTLMRIGSEDYTTNNGIKVHQDSLESAVGRIGFELGKDIGESGSVYAKASLLHDFAGSADTYLSLNGLTNNYRQDIGDTWCEAGIGFNYKTSANSYVYADVVKTFGGDVDTPWQWNAGMRWTF